MRDLEHAPSDDNNEISPVLTTEADMLELAQSKVRELIRSGRVATDSLRRLQELPSYGCER